MNWQGWVKGVVDRVFKRRSSGRSATVAQRGERAAERWLRKQGFRILQRNLRIGDDEADLIARAPDRRTIVVVEVKTRSDADSLPEERVDERKQYRLARLAAALQKHRGYDDRPFRFDVVAVNLPPDGEPRVRHIPGAFESPF